MGKTIGALTHREGIFFDIASCFGFKQRKYFNLLKTWHKRKGNISQYLSTHEIAKVQFGSGNNEIPGFLNTDILGEIPIDITEPLPFAKSSIDVLYSNHVVEHIYNKEFKFFLRESYRILKNGGMHIIATPTVERLVGSLYGNEKAKQIILDHHKQYCLDEKLFPSSLFNNIMHINFGHKYLYSLDHLSYLSHVAGYKYIKNVENFSTPDMEVNLFLKKTKNKDSSWYFETETFVLEK